MSLLHASRTAGMATPQRGLTYAEMTRLVGIAAGLGVTKIRVTGGEPLTRRNVLEFFRQLSLIESIRDIGISTNGTLLAKPVEPGRNVADTLARLRVKNLNVSLDSLDRETYAMITGRDALPETLNRSGSRQTRRIHSNPAQQRAHPGQERERPR